MLQFRRKTHAHETCRSYQSRLAGDNLYSEASAFFEVATSTGIPQPLKDLISLLRITADHIVIPSLKVAVLVSQGLQMRFRRHAVPLEAQRHLSKDCRGCNAVLILDEVSDAEAYGLLEGENDIIT